MTNVILIRDDDAFFLYLQVTLSIRKDGESLPAYMKQDGQRFKLPRTLKLAVDTTYRVDVSFKPPQILA